MEQTSQLAAVRLLACDVDGVLTDGTIFYASGSVEVKAFNIKDGLAMKLAAWNAFPVVWVTGRSSEAVERRAAELDVRVFQGSADKAAGLRRISAELSVPLAQIAYLGDDLNDLPALQLAGVPIAVADAVPEVKALAAYTTRANGGHGAVRETIEMIFRARGEWDTAVEVYLSHLRCGHAPQ